MTVPAANYNVETAWPAKHAKDADSCLRALLKMPKHVFHGVHRPCRTIESSLDLKLKNLKPRENPHEFETQLLKCFATECFRHLLPGARMHIERDRLRWNTYRTTGTMFVARHFGLPTRGVDWTLNALVAIFFACRREPEVDGVIWCMDHEEFEARVATQWPAAYGKKEHIKDDFEKDFRRGVDKDVLVPLHFPPWMPRPVAQKGLITVAGQFGVDHAQKIHQLGVRGCGRVVVPAAFKRQVIKKLDLMGVNGYTLEIGDSTVETIATDIAASLGRCKTVTKVE